MIFKGFKFSIFKIESSISIASEFSYVTIFCESHRYSKHWKMLNCGKLITVNFTLLSDIDKRKTLIESSAADVIHFLFLAGLSIGFSSGN